MTEPERAALVESVVSGHERRLLRSREARVRRTARRRGMTVERSDTGYRIVEVSSGRVVMGAHSDLSMEMVEWFFKGR